MRLGKAIMLAVAIVLSSGCSTIGRVIEPSDGCTWTKYILVGKGDQLSAERPRPKSRLTTRRASGCVVRGKEAIR